MKDILLRTLAYPLPLRLALTRMVIKKFSLFSYEDRLFLGAIDRPHYGYCIFQAAKLARSLNQSRISVIEFGCGGGNGLVNAEMHIAEVSKIVAVDIELYGFDMGSGLPRPRDYRDMPHYLRGGAFHMDVRSLQQKLKRARLVIGDVRDQCTTFFEKYNPAPIGCVFWDLDFYSSTRDALTLFDAEASHFLPRVFMYFDDIVGDDVWLPNEFTGEGLAIEEFNHSHASKKIAKNYALPIHYAHHLGWPHHVYIYHDFEHPKYNEFVADQELKKHQDAIRLR